MSEQERSTPSPSSGRRRFRQSSYKPPVRMTNPKFVLLYPLAEKTLALEEFPAALANFAAIREQNPLNFGDTTAGGWWMVAAPTDQPTQVLAVICKGLPTSDDGWRTDQKKIVPEFDTARLETYCTEQKFSYDKRPPSTRVFSMVELLSGSVDSVEAFQALLKELDERTAQFTLWYSEEAKYCSILTDDQAVLSVLDNIRFDGTPAEQLAAKGRLKILVEVLRKHKFDHGLGKAALDKFEEQVQQCKITLFSTITPGQATQVVTHAGDKLDAWRIEPITAMNRDTVGANVPGWPSWVIVEFAKRRSADATDPFNSDGWLVKLRNGNVLKFRDNDFLELFDSVE